MKRPKLFLAALCAAPLVATAASAGTRDDVLSGISRCGGIANDRAWLDCIYGAAQPMRAQLGLPPALASQQALVPPATPGSAAASVQQPAKSPELTKWPIYGHWPF